jgi:hypothetical protein
MEPLTACGMVKTLHTTSGKEKQNKPKLADETQTVLWLPQNQNHHIKRENQKPLFA